MGADVSLIQPYVGDEPTEELGDAVRGITGQELEIEGTRQIDIVFGNKQYTHSFVDAPLAVKKDGIVGLDLLRKLGTYIDIARGQIILDDQMIPLTNH